MTYHAKPDPKEQPQIVVDALTRAQQYDQAAEQIRDLLEERSVLLRAMLPFVMAYDSVPKDRKYRTGDREHHMSGRNPILAVVGHQELTAGDFSVLTALYRDVLKPAQEPQEEPKPPDGLDSLSPELRTVVEILAVYSSEVSPDLDRLAKQLQTFLERDVESGKAKP